MQGNAGTMDAQFFAMTDAALWCPPLPVDHSMYPEPGQTRSQLIAYVARRRAGLAGAQDSLESIHYRRDLAPVDFIL